MGWALEPEYRGDAGVVAVLQALAIGVLAELEQAAAIVVAVLLDGAVVAVAILEDHAVIAGAILGGAGRIAVAVLVGVGTGGGHALHKREHLQAEPKRLLLVGIAGAEADGDLSAGHG